MTNQLQPPISPSPGRFQLIIPDEEGMPAPNPPAFRRVGLVLAGVLVVGGVLVWTLGG